MLLNLKTIENVGHDVYRIILSADEPLEYQAGQYLLVEMGKDDLRPFSIASSPSKDKFIELHIGATPKNAFAWDVLERLRTIGNISATLSNGSAFLQPQEDKDIVLIAGGTGYSYLKSIAYEIASQDLDLKVDIFWGAKQASQLYEFDALVALCEAHEQFHFHPVVEVAEPDWQGKTGLVHQSAIHTVHDFSQKQVYIAGPFAMAKIARDDLYNAGLAQECLFGDAYAYI
jgi:aquacobalamin reductase/NAD(P)H-flavin reductase